MLKAFLSLFANPHATVNVASIPTFDDAETTATRDALKQRVKQWNKNNRRKPTHILNGGGQWSRDVR